MKSEKATEKSVNPGDSIPLREMKALLGAYEDLKTWLDWLPYYKPGDGQPECHHFCKEIVLFNSTVRLDYGYHAHHQGDIAVETLKGIKQRIGNSVVFIHWEHNRSDIPWNRPYNTKAVTRAEKDAFKAADIILVGDRAIVNKETVDEAKLEEAGFKVETRYEWEQLDDNFNVIKPPKVEKAKTENSGEPTGLGALFG